MKIYNNFKIEKLPNKMQHFLNQYRQHRAFNPEGIIKQKIDIINSYFDKFNLNTAIVAVSGGVDSALVLALLVKSSKTSNSPIKNIVPVFLPAYENKGVTGQYLARDRALELCNSFGLKMNELDLTKLSLSLGSEIEHSTQITSDDWSKGQLVPYLRTTSLYYFATLYTQSSNKAVIVGTTNADEGQYIGYFGKASDGLVDIQFISDLHKSEVYALSSILEVPDSIINVSPTGDMYDGRLDEEVFGAPYGFIELYRYYLNMDEIDKISFSRELINANEFETFKKLQDNIENMHRYNKHKYLGCSPAVHLDVMDTKIFGGWKYSNWTPEI